MAFQLFRPEKFPRHHRLLLVFVGIERRDSLFGGSVLLIRQPRLLQRVQIPVPGQQQRCPVADLQVFRGYGDSFRLHVPDLLHQVLRIQGHAVSQQIHHALVEDPGRKQVKGELPLLVDHGMPRVSASLIPDHDIVVLRQQIHNPAFSFVSPVDPRDYTVFHPVLLLLFRLIPPLRSWPGSAVCPRPVPG